MALAVAKAQDPVAVIQNLTQEAQQRIDMAMGGVSACLEDTRSMMCLVNVVGHNWQM
jgi:hypothetical protein